MPEDEVTRDSEREEASRSEREKARRSERETAGWPESERDEAGWSEREKARRSEREDARRRTARMKAKARGMEFASVGVGMGLTMVLLALGGDWLDRRLGTEPLFVLLGVFTGFAGGCISLLSRLAASRKSRDASRQPRDAG